MSRIVHAASIVPLAAMVLASASLRADTPVGEDSYVPLLLATRVVYLQEMSPRDAVTLVRSLHIRCVAQVVSRDALVISDEAEKIDQAEALLRQRNAVLRVADPHPPMLETVTKPPHETRVFDVDAGSMEGVMAVLRSIYQVRDVQKSEQESRVTIRAALPILDASEALLRELSLLAPKTGGDS